MNPRTRRFSDQAPAQDIRPYAIFSTYQSPTGEDGADETLLDVTAERGTREEYERKLEEYVETDNPVVGSKWEVPEDYFKEVEKAGYDVDQDKLRALFDILPEVEEEE